MTSNAAYWPPHLPRSLPRVETTLPFALRVTAARYGSRPAIGFFGRDMNWRDVEREVEAFAGWLRRRAGLARGDRVAIFAQNSPQWLIAYYGILRADCVAVPVNPMMRAGELRYVLADSGARAAVVAQDLVPTAREAAGGAADLRHIVAVTYADYLPEAPDFALQDWLLTPARRHEGCTPWAEAIGAGLAAPAPEAMPEDLALLPYTSGSTGVGKGCEHPHSTFMHTSTGLALWHGQTAATVFLGLPPMYQVSGIANCLHCPVTSGGMMIPVPRWDRKLALGLIERYRVSHLAIAPTACIDMLASPDLGSRDLSSLRRVTAGGAPMPQEVWRRLHAATGLPFIEAYGMTEAAATTHINPIERPKPQCLGVAFFDTEVAVAHPDTLEDVAPGEPGEILVRGPQMFRGYWGKPKETAEAFCDRDGVRWYRSGDMGYVDEEGYFFMTDRLKRMINASGFKVWPAEVETKLYEHPDVLEACVISQPDPYRGETVKAVISLKAGRAGAVTAEEIMAWARTTMAPYKIPRVVEFVESLPKSPVGKIMWRELQDREKQLAEAGRAMTEVPLVTYELAGEVALIGLDRPAKRNAINDATLADLAAALKRAGEEAKAGVIFGHGAHFSAGLDLSEALRTRGQGDPRRPRSRNWHATFDLMARGPIPFVAALSGAVIGGGLELASAAHIRVADETAFFALPEGQRGIFVGGGGSVRIERLLGYARMADLMLTGRVLSAAEGERLNLAQYLVPKGEALAKARALAERICQNAPLSNYAITNGLPRMRDLSHDDGLFFESLLAQSTSANREAADRLQAFDEKRSPRLEIPGEER